MKKSIKIGDHVTTHRLPELANIKGTVVDASGSHTFTTSFDTGTNTNTTLFSVKFVSGERTQTLELLGSDLTLVG